MNSTGSSRVTVQFAVTFDYARFYTEAELEAAAPDVLARIAGAPTIEGAIDVSADGAPSTRIIDELAPWIQNLCFRAVSTLAGGEPVQVLYFSRSGVLDLVPRDGLIALSGNKNPPASYPAQPLMHALVDCGSRFLSFASKVKQGDLTYMANIDYVRQFEELARDAIGGL